MSNCCETSAPWSSSVPNNRTLLRSAPDHDTLTEFIGCALSFFSRASYSGGTLKTSPWTERLYKPWISPTARADFLWLLLYSLCSLLVCLFLMESLFINEILKIFSTSHLWFFFNFLLVICGIHIMQSNPTYLPIHLLLPPALATSAPKENLEVKQIKWKTDKQIKDFDTRADVAQWVTQYTL